MIQRQSNMGDRNTLPSAGRERTAIYLPVFWCNLTSQETNGHPSTDKGQTRKILLCYSFLLFQISLCSFCEGTPDIVQIFICTEYLGYNKYYCPLCEVWPTVFVWDRFLTSKDLWRPLFPKVVSVKDFENLRFKGWVLKILCKTFVSKICFLYSYKRLLQVTTGYYRLLYYTILYYVETFILRKGV